MPPVKLKISPALDSDRLTLDYHKNVKEIELDEVTRQHDGSGILANANLLRILIEHDANHMQFDLKYPDVIRLIDGYDIEDAIVSSYDHQGVEDTTFIVRSNKRANLYNQPNTI